eukprot:TRINITY_DN113219_c0_g1_i1.p1 TRINITY_DN113219_c0_g1~~TRINITY_DN113219_c0_g1_i1.p1  ORF type:complete len:156 (+),score=39.71 TRINITY_DN113219_c0_g1_i1:56-523(+)
MGKGADRLYTAGVIVAAYFLISEVKTWYDDWKWSRLAKKRKELEAKMRIEPREDWSEADLKQYDGKDPDKPILVAMDGRVFNVWRGRHFYGADGCYECFAGRDATRLMAKQILEDEEDDGEVLSESELENLAGWKAYFTSKYDDVGSLARAIRSF